MHARLGCHYFRGLNTQKPSRFLLSKEIIQSNQKTSEQLYTSLTIKSQDLYSYTQEHITTITSSISKIPRCSVKRDFFKESRSQIFVVKET